MLEEDVKISTNPCFSSTVLIQAFSFDIKTMKCDICTVTHCLNMTEQ